MVCKHIHAGPESWIHAAASLNVEIFSCPACIGIVVHTEHGHTCCIAPRRQTQVCLALHCGQMTEVDMTLEGRGDLLRFLVAQWPAPAIHVEKCVSSPKACHVEQY
jgi:hypothetical protein